MLTGRNTDNQRDFTQQGSFLHLNSSPFLYPLIIAIAILLPLLLWQLKKIDAAPFVSFTRPEDIPFELFGGFASFTLLLISWLEIKRRRIKHLASALPILLGLLVSLTFLFNIAESTFNGRFNSDYIAFEKGAKAIVNGISPYIDQENPYVYPPLPGQVMAFLFQLFTNIPFLSTESTDEGWKLVFYFFQCAQLLLISSAYFLTYSFARKIGLRVIPASLIVAALFLFNNSVIRTLNFHQTNLWILNCFLIGALFQQTRPFISGFAAALGVHVKMYPFILMLPWFALRKWQLLLGSIIGLVAIAIAQTNLGRDWTLLRLFFDYLKVVSKPTPYRNNSVNSVVNNFFKIPDRLFSTSFDLVPIIVTVLTLLIAVWFFIRFIHREKIYRELIRSAKSEDQTYWSEIFRFDGHSMDAIALGLLISPSVYEHHYIVAIPVALWAITTRKLDKPMLVGFSIFLIFCVPAFDLFPFSFHRLLGLLMLVHFTAPESVKNYFLLIHKRSQKSINSQDLL